MSVAFRTREEVLARRRALRRRIAKRRFQSFVAQNDVVKLEDELALVEALIAAMKPEGQRR